VHVHACMSKTGITLPLGRRLAVLTCACLLGACAFGPQASPAAFLATETSGPADTSFSALVTARNASVVDISTLRIGRDETAGDLELEFAPETDFADRLALPFPASVRVSEIRDLASGVILTSDGLILTSAHVVAAIDEAQVRLDDGRRFPAKVLGIDRRTDVALLKIDAAGLPTAVIGDSSKLAPGDWVAAIGAPFGFHGSVTAGVVSAVDRFIGGAGEIPFIQTDVAINPGSSGSPLFNHRGEVVAINSMIYSGSGGYMGLSFAVPIDLAMKVAAQLKASGRVRRARIGTDFQEMTPALAQAFGSKEMAGGALVVRVDVGSPAQAAGLAAGDIVTALDGTPIAHFTELLRQIAERPPGSRARLDVWRQGKRQTIAVTLVEDPSPKSSLRPDLSFEWNDGLGLRLGELTPPQHLQLGSTGGLMVREAAGVARSEGIREGDLIVAVNESRLDRVEDFRQSLKGLPPGRIVALLVMRDHRMAYVPVRVPRTRTGAPD